MIQLIHRTRYGPNSYHKGLRLDWQTRTLEIIEWLQDEEVQRWLLLVLACASSLWLGMLIHAKWCDWRDRRQGSQVRGRGRKMEVKAAALLKSSGYRILQTTPQLTMMLRIEGDDARFQITPDFLVEKDGEQLIVEVKYWSGNTPAIHNAIIRRQVIEYLAASGLPCLLLEMPQGYVSRIDANLDFL